VNEMDDATADHLMELKLAGVALDEGDMRRAGVLHPQGTMPPTAFGMPDLKGSQPGWFEECAPYAGYPLPFLAAMYGFGKLGKMQTAGAGGGGRRPIGCHWQQRQQTGRRSQCTLRGRRR
jgi:hypothetical protein